MIRKVMIASVLILSVFSIFIGASTVTINQIIAGDEKALIILFVSRIPRLVSVLVTGVGLSISGLIMQQLSRNRFVSPSTAVTMDAAKLGLLLSSVLLTSFGIMGRMLFTFIFALLGSFLFTFLIRKVRFKNAIFIPLLGIMLGGVINSITTYIAYQFDMVQFLNSLMMGDFTHTLKGRYELLYIVIPFIILAFFYANRFTLAGMGEDFAKNLGLNYGQVVNIGLSIVSVITAAVVIIVGSIPFVGLIIPNIVSLYRGDNMKETIVDVGLFGANFLLLCDIIGRMIIYPYEVSIGLTVGVIGSIAFLILLFRRFAHEG
ncbi:MAG TPA: iron chelate uptake ABC transporter family permease subunit [Haloplasmataceae bacterium]